MTTDLEVHSRPVGALAVADGQTAWTTAQHAALVQIGIGDAPLGDQLVLLHYAQRTGLDPFSKQIYMIGRSDKATPGGKKWSIQTGIDGFRVIARRTADRLGETLEYEDTQWCAEDGIWHDVWLANKPPAAAKVAVVRDGRRFSAVARFGSYAQTTFNGDLTKQWASMGDVMIAKCAEALALRKAYPQDLAGIYTTEEMQQKDSPTADQQARVPSDAERASWLAEWAKRFHEATTVGELENLGTVANHAVRTGHASEELRESLRGQLREKAAAFEAARADAPVDEQTLTRLHTLLTNRGVANRDDRLTVAVRIIGRQVDSTKDLTAGEAQMVIDAAEHAPPGFDLITGEVIPEGVGVTPDEVVA